MSNMVIIKDYSDDSLFLNLDAILKIESIINEDGNECAIITFIGGVIHRIKISEFNKLIKMLEEKEELSKQRQEFMKTIKI